MKSKRVLSLVAAFLATSIYGINHLLAKDVMSHYMQPFGLVYIRVLGGAILFWSLGLFVPKQTIHKKDILRIILCACFGVSMNMLFFFKGLSYTTPINSSLIITISPVIAFVLSAIIIKEKMPLIRILGVLVGLVGASMLILLSNEVKQSAPNIPLGNFLAFVNATFFALYLIFSKPLLKKYHFINLTKWIFLVGVVINFPICYKEVSTIDWVSIPQSGFLKIGYVLVGTTFFAYLLNMYALKTLNASTLSVFAYFQPFVAIVASVILAKEYLTVDEFIAAIMVFIGVYLVSKKSKIKAQG